mmetsp:Transcript_33376/g.70212  ORF Transcript_33376/g.70212 Transcript_33376/m.70212 type:complete len:994 (+) Transcript_33376:210-3191(+)
MAVPNPLAPPSDSDGLSTHSPHNNDVLCGRGGTINAHPGNEQYRKFVDRKKRVYLTARFKREKRLIAQSIVDEIRNLNPPGRFLSKDTSALARGIWRDVGDEKARDKTSQALRENALSVRKQMEEEFHETRRQQAREVAIAAGRDPEEAVKNMMGAAAAASVRGVATKQKDTPPHQSPPNQMPGQQGGRPQPAGGFAARSGYGGPLYEAQQPAPPQPAAPAPWGYHPPPPATLYHAPHAPGAPPPPPHSHYPYFSAPSAQQGMPPPVWTGSSQQQQPPHSASLPSHSYPPPPGSQQPHVYNQYNTNWQQSNPQQHPQHPQQQHQQQQHQPQHTISQQPMMPQQSSLPPNTTSDTAMSPHPMPPAAQPTPPPGTPSSPPTRPASTVTTAMNNNNSPPRRLSSLNNSHDNSPNHRHVQFQNTNANNANNSNDSVPLIISSKKRIQPRMSEYSPSANMSASSSSYNQQQQQSTISPQSSPRSHSGNMSQAMSHHTTGTSATALTFLSTDLSVKTSDSLNHYLQGLEDEISGDVGQEVELVAHAPMLANQQHNQNQQQRHNHGGQQHHGGIPTYKSPPRHHHKSGHKSNSGGNHSTSGNGGSSQKSGNPRRRKRRSGGYSNHVPSNSGKIQLDLSTLSAAGDKGLQAGQMPQQAGQAGQMREATSPVQSNMPCGHGAGCGVILPTPLRSSNNNNNNSNAGRISQSPGTTAMAPPPGVPPSMLLPLSPIAIARQHQQHHQHHHHGNTNMAPIQAPLSPQSLDFDKMSLCGTENVSHTGGSIGGASLCNVFDDHDQESVIGGASANLMDMMSLGSHPSRSSGGSLQGIQPIPLGLNPQTVFGEVHHEGENDSYVDMSVGGDSSHNSQGHTYKGGAGGSQNSGSRSSSSRSRQSGRSGSPASMDKASLDGLGTVPTKIDEVEEVQHQQQMHQVQHQQLQQQQQVHHQEEVGMFDGEGRDQPPGVGAVAQQQHHQLHQQQHLHQPYYGQDFKFNWDGKRDN